jgi:hypothetical protein
MHLVRNSLAKDDRFRQVKTSYSARDLGWRDAGIAVAPGHPLLRVAGQFFTVLLQFRQIGERTPKSADLPASLRGHSTRR